MKKHRVKSSDILWQIARYHGLSDEKSLSSLPENSELFLDGNRNDFRIYPGDVIYIPEVTPACHEVAVNGKRVFKTPSRKGYLRLKVVDESGDAISNFKYEVKIADLFESGDQSSHGGDIEVELPTHLESNEIIFPSNNSKQRPTDNLSTDELLKQTTAQLKLFTNPNSPNEYSEYTISFNLSPKNETVGRLQQMTNQNRYFGCIPNQPYEQSVGRIDKTCYPDDDTSKHYFENEINQGSHLLPMPSPVNFQPQYYPVAWESLRYARIYELAEMDYKFFEGRLEAAKKSGNAYDALNIATIKAKMDKDYYQYIFNYWISEFSKLKQAHVTNKYSIALLTRVRQDVMVDEKLKALMSQWKKDLNGTESELLAMEFPYQDMPPMKYNAFTTVYSTQHAKERLSTHIVSPPMTSRARFCYDDKPDQPITNSYVLYWRYDKNDNNKIESGREDFYRKACMMMPIGIGKTDDKGYLVQSVPFDDQYLSQFLKIENNQLTMHGGASADFQSIMAQKKSDVQQLASSIKPLKRDWNTLFNHVNSGLPGFGIRIYNRLLDNRSLNAYLDINRAESYDAVKSKLVELNEIDPNYYKHYRVTTSNHLFNYYSSGSQDTWGFMVYPPDGGLFQTQDLAKLGNQGKYAFKGPIKAPNNQADFIALPCTLQEWERRLKVQSHKLQAAVESFQLHSSSHAQNIDSLGRMSGLLNLYERYPYEHEEASSASKLERQALAVNVTKLTKDIQNIIQKPDAQKDKGMHDALANMKEVKDAIIELLQADGFREQLALYQDAFVNTEENVSPYMVLDETWQSVYTTIADALAFLSMIPDADEVFKKLLKPVLDPLIASNMVTELIKKGLPEMIKAMDESGGDTIPINRQGDTVIETPEELAKVVKDIYTNKSKQNTQEAEPSVLNQIFSSAMYQDAAAAKGDLDKWVHSTPGAPSIFMVILEYYSSFVISEAIRNGATKGYHIRIMMAIAHCFGFFSDDAKIKESSILNMLRSNKSVRNAAKVDILEGQLKIEEKTAKNLKKNIDGIENKIKSNDCSPKQKENLKKKLQKKYLNLAKKQAEISNSQDAIKFKKENILSSLRREIRNLEDIRTGRIIVRQEYLDNLKTSIKNDLEIKKYNDELDGLNKLLSQEERNHFDSLDIQTKKILREKAGNLHPNESGGKIEESIKKEDVKLAIKRDFIRNKEFEIAEITRKRNALEIDYDSDIKNKRIANADHTDEFYDHADGNKARVYKSILMGMSIVALVEDWARCLRLNSDTVDADIIMANYAKTITDSGVTFTSAMVLVNRWVDADKEILARGKFLKDGGAFFAKHADRLAVIGSIVGLYMNSRDLYETYNNKTLLDKTDSCLSLAADAVTAVGYILTKRGVNMAGTVIPRLLLGSFISASLIPGLGQLLMMIGVGIMLAQMGLQYFREWQAREFRSNEAVGYYFWQEFEAISKKSQRYNDADADNDTSFFEEIREKISDWATSSSDSADNCIANTDQFNTSQDANSDTHIILSDNCATEATSYATLFYLYDKSALLGKNASKGGWGHLSWRGAVPFFISWRRMGIKEDQLLTIIKDLSKVPDIIVSESTTSPLNKKVNKLLSPKVIVKFYLYLEKIKQENPEGTIQFISGGALTYQAVMNQLEQGIYMPEGETDNVIEHLEDINDSEMPASLLGISTMIETKHIVWDHEHFQLEFLQVD